MLHNTLMLFSASTLKNFISFDSVQELLQSKKFWSAKLCYSFGINLDEITYDEVNPEQVYFYISGLYKGLSGLDREQFIVRVLRHSIRHDEIDVIKCMMTLPNFGDFCNNAIVFAAKHNMTYPLMQLIMSPHANTGYCDSLALRTAISHNHVECTKYLLSYQNTDPNANGGEPLRIAIQKRNCDIINHILDHHLTITTHCLQDAVECEDLYILQLIIEDPRTDLNENDQQIFYMCIDTGYIDAAKMIGSDRRFNVTNQKCRPIIYCLELIELLDEILTEDRYISRSSATELVSETIERNIYPAFELLLYHPAFVDKYNPNTLLILSIKLDRTEFSTILLSKCRCTNLQDAFQLSCTLNRYVLVHIFLMDNRIDPCAQNNNAMRAATQNQAIETIIFLLGDGRADPTIDDNALWKYASSASSEILTMILQTDTRIQQYLERSTESEDE